MSSVDEPITAEMNAASRAKFSEWCGILRDAFEAEEIDHSEFLMARYELDLWYSWDGWRIDQIYLALHPEVR